jgi:DnaJ like chaperone protein
LSEFLKNFFKVEPRKFWFWLPWYASLLPGSFRNKRQTLFFTTVFLMLAKLAKVDGAITRDELSAVDDFIATELELDSRQKIQALQIFREAKNSQSSFEYCATQYFQHFGQNKVMLENMIELLLTVAHADNRYCFDEEKLVRTSLNIFGLSELDYQRLKSHQQLRQQAKRPRGQTKQQYKSQTFSSSGSKNNNNPQETIYQTPLEIAYKILECSPNDSDAAIKKKYRQLALKHHPDRQMAQGVPKEMIKVFESQFRQIQQAFETVDEHRRRYKRNSN